MSTTRFPYEPHLVRINLYGPRPRYDRRVRGPLLDTLLSRREWVPETDTIDDEPEEPFSRETGLSKALHGSRA